jgi:hypothetical protein
MKRRIWFFSRRFLLLSMGVVLLASLFACHRQGGRKDLEVTAKTNYSGTINGSPISIDVVATINTGRGGRSSCTLTNGPSGFNLAALGTMA